MNNTQNNTEENIIISSGFTKDLNRNVQFGRYQPDVLPWNPLSRNSQDSLLGIWLEKIMLYLLEKGLNVFFFMHELFRSGTSFKSKN